MSWQVEPVETLSKRHKGLKGVRKIFLSSFPGYLGELNDWNPIQNSEILSSNATIQGFSQNFSVTHIVDKIDSATANVPNNPAICLFVLEAFSFISYLLR